MPYENKLIITTKLFNVFCPGFSGGDSNRIAALDGEIAVLQQRLQQLQHLLNTRDHAADALHEDINNLRKEVSGGDNCL